MPTFPLELELVETDRAAVVLVRAPGSSMKRFTTNAVIAMQAAAAAMAAGSETERRARLAVTARWSPRFCSNPVRTARVEGLEAVGPRRE